MRAQSSSPVRGLLAGLLALATFASGAVALTAGGSSSGSTPTQAAQPRVTAVATPTTLRQGAEGEHARFDGHGDGDGGGRHR